MILIYNLPGLRVGVAGLAVGLVVVMASGWLSAGLVAVGLVWLAIGRGKVDPASGVRRVSPAFFYIPLFYWAFVALLLAFPAAMIDRNHGRKAQDPRYLRFKLDEQTLDRDRIAGDPKLGQLLVNALGGGLVDDETHIFSSTQEKRVLVLVKAPRLKRLDESAKRRVAASLEEVIQTSPGLKDRPLYLGIKGAFAYGVVKTPQGIQVGKVVGSDPLLDFYENPVVPPTSQP